MVLRRVRAKTLKRNILQFTGLKPIRTTLYGMIERAGDAKWQRWLREMETPRGG
jgi:NAD(P)H dehydrogenase (quinone)